MLPQNPAIAEGLWAATRSYFLKIQWNFTKIGSARSRLYQGILSFLFGFVERVLLFRSFSKKNIKIRKKEREKILNENRDFSDFHTLRRTFFGKISWNFWFFGVTLGKISSRSSQPWRKNKKRKFFGLFLAGRNLWNFGATPYCKSEQTRLYHNSAKSARIGLRF